MTPASAVRLHAAVAGEGGHAPAPRGRPSPRGRRGFGPRVRSAPTGTPPGQRVPGCLGDPEQSVCKLTAPPGGHEEPGGKSPQGPLPRQPAPPLGGWPCVPADTRPLAAGVARSEAGTCHAPALPAAARGRPELPRPGGSPVSPSWGALTVPQDTCPCVPHSPRDPGRHLMGDTGH